MGNRFKYEQVPIGYGVEMLGPWRAERGTDVFYCMRKDVGGQYQAPTSVAPTPEESYAKHLGLSLSGLHALIDLYRHDTRLAYRDYRKLDKMGMSDDPQRALAHFFGKVHISKQERMNT